MQWSTFEDTELQATLVAVFGVVRLQNNTDTLSQKDKANQWLQKFLLNNDCGHGDNTADGQ